MDHICLSLDKGPIWCHNKKDNILVIRQRIYLVSYQKGLHACQMIMYISENIPKRNTHLPLDLTCVVLIGLYIHMQINGYTMASKKMAHIFANKEENKFGVLSA